MGNVKNYDTSGTKMDFLSIPVDIRLLIYEELFTVPKPIVIKCFDQFCGGPLRYKYGKSGLRSGILRTNKEATPILYSRNRFAFIDSWSLLGHDSSSGALAFLLWKIGPRNATFLRHCCMDTPTFDIDTSGNIAFQPECISTLDLIGEKHLGLTSFTMTAWFCPKWKSSLVSH